MTLVVARFRSRVSFSIVLACLVGGASLAVVALDDVARRGGGITGDEATYVGMAASAGLDGDLVFTGRDYQRFRAWYGSGPEGIFLKRGAPTPSAGDGERLYFGKAYVYGVLAAPFARVGGPGGLFAFNVVCLGLVVYAGYRWLRPGSRAAPALMFTCAFVLASVAPLYAFWLTAETLNFALVFLAFAAVSTPGDEPGSSRARHLAGALCLGAAIFSKPLNLPLALPFAMVVGGDERRRALMSLTMVGTIVVGLFAVNGVITGELNYQGGERKTFYGEFPYDEAGRSFDSAGIGMTTNTVQTPVGEEGRLAPLAQNAWYFVAGRHFGLIPFGWPWLVAIGLWGVGERHKSRWQWALLASLALAALITIVWMPYTWSGGGGPVGNRYFLSLGAATFFLVPRIRTFAPAAMASIGLLFVAPSLARPFAVTRQPWLATEAAVFRALPIEMTGASDLPVILDPRRGRIPQGRRPTVFVALLDNAGGMGQSGWLAVASNQAADLLVRSPERLQDVTVGIKAPEGCEVALQSGASRLVTTLGDGDRQDHQMVVPQTFSRDSFAFLLRVDASACGAPIEVALQGRP